MRVSLIMAPIEPDLTNSNVRPLLAAAGYLTTITFLLMLISYRVYYRAYISLPPSQATRSREHSRNSHTEIFAGLATVCLGVTIYYGYQFLLLSYQIWAYERGEVVPTGLASDEGLLAANGPKLFIGRWFHDTDLIGELWEICVEKTRRRWWTNQLFLSTTAWSLYVSIKGRSHAIPHLWAFVALAPLVSLSFAMNLFFLAVLLTPLPLPEDATAPNTRSSKRQIQKPIKSLKSAAATAVIRTDSFLQKIYNLGDSYFPPKPQNWTPHPLVSFIPLGLTLVHTVLLSFASNTTAFHSLLNLLLLDIFLPILLPAILPQRWGSSNASRHHHTKSLTIFSILSLALHLFQTMIAIFYNDPGAHRHRHLILSFHHEADRTRTARTTTALARIVRAISDHPAVGKIGSDVVLTAVSLATWAAVRGMDPRHMLRAAGWATYSELDVVDKAKDIIARELQHLIPSSNHEDSLSEGRGAKTIENSESTGETGYGARAFRGTANRIGEEEEETEWESGVLAVSSHYPFGATVRSRRSMKFFPPSQKYILTKNKLTKHKQWGMVILGGLGTGVAAVLGSDIGL